MQTKLGSHVGNGPVNVHYAYVARYTYSDIVVQNDNFLRLSAYTDVRQRAESYDVFTSPVGRKVCYSDRLGNVVHRVRVIEPHEELVIAAFGKAALEPRFPSVPDLALSDLALDPVADEFLTPTPLVDPTAVEEPARDVTAGADTLLEAVEAVTAWVWKNVRYLRGNTSVSTTALQVLSSLEGVCQDKTHLALGMLRSLGIPSRYVSGLLTRQPGETHAWLEFLHPNVGWLPADPTKGVVIETGTNYLKFGVGRDYTEIPPVTGSFVSRGSGRLDVATARVFFDRDTVTLQDAINLIDNYLE